jgi:hypothetical protein
LRVPRVESTASDNESVKAVWMTVSSDPPYSQLIVAIKPILSAENKSRQLKQLQIHIHMSIIHHMCAFYHLYKTKM